MIPQQIETLISPELITTENDTLLSISGISWSQYEILLSKLNDHAGLRIKYLDGILTIMSPSSPSSLN